jgi:saccharopine dehydrogenase-like NADP-dependent oxidoreductase
VGIIDVFHVGHPEPITLSRRFKEVKIINNKATFYPAYINDLIISLGNIVRESGGKIKVKNAEIDVMDFAAAYLHKRCKSIKNTTKEGALRVTLKGKRRNNKLKIIYASSWLLAKGTGISASIGAQMLAHGKINKKGVLPPEECVDLRSFLRKIISRGIGRLDIKEEKVQ